MGATHMVRAFICIITFASPPPPVHCGSQHLPPSPLPRELTPSTHSSWPSPLSLPPNLLCSHWIYSFASHSLLFYFISDRGENFNLPGHQITFPPRFREREGGSTDHSLVLRPVAQPSRSLALHPLSIPSMYSSLPFLYLALHPLSSLYLWFSFLSLFPLGLARLPFSFLCLSLSFLFLASIIRFPFCLSLVYLSFMSLSLPPLHTFPLKPPLSQTQLQTARFKQESHNSPILYFFFVRSISSLFIARLSPYVFIDTFSLELLPYTFQLLCFCSPDGKRLKRVCHHLRKKDVLRGLLSCSTCACVMRIRICII